MAEENAVGGREARHRRVVSPRLEPIEAPRNTSPGLFIAFFATVMGFALIWHIWGMSIVGVDGLFAAVLAQGWRVSGEGEAPVAAPAAASHGMDGKLSPYAAAAQANRRRTRASTLIGVWGPQHFRRGHLCLIKEISTLWISPPEGWI